MFTRSSGVVNSAPDARSLSHVSSAWRTSPLTASVPQSGTVARNVRFSPGASLTAYDAYPFASPAGHAAPNDSPEAPSVEANIRAESPPS